MFTKCLATFLKSAPFKNVNSNIKFNPHSTRDVYLSYICDFETDLKYWKKEKIMMFVLLYLLLF